MPKGYDLQRLTVTHSPTDKIDTSPGKLPPLDISVFTDGLIELLKELTGIDLSSPEAFIASIIDLITTGGPALEIAAAILNQIGSLIGIPNLGAFLTQIEAGFGGLASILGLGGIGDLTGAIDVEAILSNFITEQLNPLGLLEGILDPILQGNLESIFGDIDLNDDGLDAGDVWNAITGTFLNPRIVDVIFEAVTGLDRGDDDPIIDLQDVLQHIPFLNVLGIGGPGNIGGSVQSGWDQLIGGLVGTLGSGAGLADLFNIGQAVSSRATLGQFSWDILGIRSNKSLNTGFLPTSESNISLDKVALAAVAPTVAVTQSTALTTFIRISEAASKGAVSWQGSGVTNVTHCLVNIFKMDVTTGDMDLVHASANIVGNLSGSMAQVVYALPTPIDVDATEVYGIEIAIRGVGTHSVAGASSWLPDQQVYPRRFSAVRNSGTSAPPDSIASGSVVYSNNVPFVEFGVSAGEVAIPHTPQTTLVNTVGTTTIPIPSWANFIEVAALGGGGGGHQGGTWGIGGEGGDNGAWLTDTWVRGVDFTSGVASVTAAVGAGGAGGTGNGANGGGTTISIPGHSVTGAGGVGANSFDVLGSEHSGESPGSFTHGGITYVGGAQQDTYGANGAPPGGGGAGGNWVSFQGGGNGASGAAWIRFRQS